MRQLLLLVAFLLPVCAYAQFEETFDGPEITTQNPWSGDADCFAIQDGWLVSHADVGRKSAALFLPLSYAPTMQWEFEVSMSFKPSDRNHIRLHVYTDRSEQENILIDYSLQIGNNNHSVVFRKQARNKKTADQLFTKALDQLDAPTQIRFKLTLENRATWSLYMYDQGEYVLLAYCESAVSPSTTQGDFGLECRYTKTRANGFSFNYIHVRHGLSSETERQEEPKEPKTETTLPQLVALEALSRSAFQLEYDQPVDISEAVFSLSDIGKANYQHYVNAYHTQVEIRFEKELQLGKDYDFTCAGIKDVRGNKIPDVTNRILLRYDDGTDQPKDPETPEEPKLPSFSEGSIRINEVMADPPKDQADLANTEYVELYNTTNEAIDLSNWQFFYGDKSVPLANTLLEANQYVVLYHADREMKIDSDGKAMPLSDFPYRLANAGKELRLQDPSGKEVDRIAYEAAKYGISWERSASGFYLSTDKRGGTPGSVNSARETEPEQPKEPEKPVKPDDPVIPQAMLVFPKEVVFNELLPDPFVGGSEYIELYNRSDRPISFAGLTIATRKSDGTLNTHYPLSSLSDWMQPGDYVLLTKDKNGVEPFYLVKNAEALHAVKLPILANTSSTLVLFNQSDESVVDEVNYSDDWHAAGVKQTKGVSLERIDPERETQDRSNWTSASSLDGGGTPGYQNSQYGVQNEEGVTGIEAPEYVEISKDYSIAYRLDQAGYVCRAWVFDMSGRQVTEMINYELLAIEGVLKWNGLASGGAKVKTGVYIFYAELVHPTGKVIRVRKVFVVK